MDNTLKVLKLLFIPFEGNNFRPKFLQSKILFYFAVFLFIFRLSASIVSVNFSQNIFFADVTRTALINLVNQSREAQGLGILAENQKLDQAAMLKAEDMLKNNYFAHNSPQGITPWYWFLQSGYNYKYAGENLAIGFMDSKEIFNAWFDSPSHKENILNPNYKESGLAILNGNFGGGETTVVVQLFGSPLSMVKTIQTEIQQPMKATEQNPRATNNQSTAENLENDREVLSQTSEYPVLKTAGPENSNTLYLKFLNFIYYQYDEIIEIVIYGFFLLIVVAILLNIVIYFNIQHKDLVIRSIIIIILLLLIVLIDRGAITLFFSNKITI
jgi:hypothetical protein